MSERQVADRLMGEIEGRDDVVMMRNNTGMARDGRHAVRFGLGVGSADWILCWRGRFVGVEVKTGRYRQTERQKRWQANIERAGGLYRILDESTDATALAAELDRLTDSGSGASATSA